MSSVKFGLAGKVIAVTGAGSGIGLATTKLLLAEGAHVSAADINASAIEELCDGASPDIVTGKLLTYTVDVRKPEEVVRWIETTVQHFGRLDGAANVAGVVAPKTLLVDIAPELDQALWHDIFDVNIHGVMYCMRAQLQSMRDGGSVVNASSISGLMGLAKHSAYTATKHAVIGLSKAVAKEVGHRRIRVNCVAPGLVDTPMHGPRTDDQKVDDVERPNTTPLPTQINRFARPEEAAALIAWLLSPATAYITGTVQVLDGGMLC